MNMKGHNGNHLETIRESSKIVLSINFAVSFWHINLHTDTSKSIFPPSASLTDTNTPNWYVASLWSPHATI